MVGASRPLTLTFQFWSVITGDFVEFFTSVCCFLFGVLVLRYHTCVSVLLRCHIFPFASFLGNPFNHLCF